MKQGNAIELKNVSKSFRLEVRDDSSKGLIRKNKTSTVKHTVFSGINLEVKKGEILGVLGRNGSGKSTLLSIIAKILEPDTGTVEVDGKVASILALGMGFQGDMSGRENIYLKGELYGFSRKQMAEKIDGIIEFSGLKEYIDNPLKTYSSGMSGRLAFSIMLHVDADIMLVDEVLSTGDATFSAKAKTAFMNIIKSGKTVVFVSHGISAVEDFCTRAVWIEKGKIVADGKTKTVCAKYMRAMTESFEIIYDQAVGGVSAAQYTLALMYRDGKKVEKNDELYREWIKKAAEQGHSEAQVLYADMLLESESEEDRGEAFVYYQAAASKGNSNARMKLSALSGGEESDSERVEVIEICRQLAESGIPADVLRYGNVLLRTAWNEDDRILAYSQFVKAAEDGSPDALYQMAIMSRDGVGTVHDNEKYIEYLEMAADAGHSKAIAEIAAIYREGKLVDQNLAKAFDYYLKAARGGSAQSQYRVACMYRDGEGTESNKEKSDRWFKIYSHAAIAPYQYILADTISSRLEIDANPDDLIKKSALNYNTKGIVQLASIYKNGSSQFSNVAQAKECYLMAAEVSASSRLALADMYYEGLLFEQDYKKAAEIYCKLSYALDMTRCYRLHLMYRDGIGVDKNAEKADIYLRRAAIKGHRQARKTLVMDS